MGKFIDFHNKCIADKQMQITALCDEFEYDSTFRLFKPTLQEAMLLPNWQDRYADDITEYGPSQYSTMAWASGHSDNRWRQYTKLRETIVLFCAAIEGEI